MTTTTQQRETQNWTPGTVGDDVMTVHKVWDGKPVCGESGKVDEWCRAVNCPECLAAEADGDPGCR